MEYYDTFARKLIVDIKSLWHLALQMQYYDTFVIKNLWHSTLQKGFLIVIHFNYMPRMHHVRIRKINENLILFFKVYVLVYISKNLVGMHCHL
jgi:hypothetical protein